MTRAAIELVPTARLPRRGERRRQRRCRRVRRQLRGPPRLVACATVEHLSVQYCEAHLRTILAAHADAAAVVRATAAREQPGPEGAVERGGGAPPAEERPPLAGALLPAGLGLGAAAEEHRAGELAHVDAARDQHVLDDALRAVVHDALQRQHRQQLWRHVQLPPPVPDVRVGPRHHDVPVVHARLARGDPQQCRVEQPQWRVRRQPSELEPAEDDPRVPPPPRTLVRL